MSKRKNRRKPRRRPVSAVRSPRQFQPHDDQMMTLEVWCWMNGFSPRTGRRILQSGDGPKVVQLSTNRIGITYKANRDWQESRTR
jgi:hypothetical protein